MSETARAPTQASEVRSVLVDVPSGYIPPYKELVPVEEVLVDGIANAALINGLLRFSLFVERPDMNDDGKPVRPIVCRLVMTVSAAELIRQTIGSMLSDVVAAGAIPKTAPEGEQR